MPTQRPTLVTTRTRPPSDTRGDLPECTVPALGQLLDRLSENRVRYCHWKSNEHLAAGLAGQTDLDLLIERDDAERFRDLCRGAGMMELRPPPAKRYPGMEHWLGFDDDTGRLFHLHVHVQLVLGEEHVKNHHLPLERVFLDSARPFRGVPVPAPELELGVLVVRSLLKYRNRDIVKDLVGIRSPGLRESTRAELDWLLERTDVDAVRSALRRTGDTVPGDVVGRFLEAYAQTPRAGATFLVLRGRLRSTLRTHQRHGRLRAGGRRLEARWRKRLGASARMVPAGGGRTFALIGADGSGKSTMAGELARWLGWKIDARLYYLGSKSPSRWSRWSYLAFRALRRGQRSASRRFGSGSAAAGSIAAVRDVVLALHHLAVGHDRARRVRMGRRQARAGRVVIFDRFPLAVVSERSEHLVLDGPRIRTTLGGRRGWPFRALAEREERLYRSFGLPDELVVLHVSPEVAAERKPDHRPEVLAAKSRAADDLADLSRGAGVTPIRIDADHPLDEVLLELKRRLWHVI